MLPPCEGATVSISPGVVTSELASWMDLKCLHTRIHCSSVGAGLVRDATGANLEKVVATSGRQDIRCSTH